MTTKLPGPAASGELHAYLITREDGAWREVFRLSPGRVTTIGRSSANRVVLEDDLCSRNHCQVFHRDGDWVLRDLGSRNGTRVDDDDVNGDWNLRAGQFIQIGSVGLAFTLDLSDPIPQSKAAALERKTRAGIGATLERPSDVIEPAILHRRHRSRLGVGDELQRDRTSRELSRLYRLGLEMGAARDSGELCNAVLRSLAEETAADIIAILLLPETPAETPQQALLQIVAYHSSNDLPYRRVSDKLSHVVLSEREALLARHLTGESELAGSESLADLDVLSVICAPIRTPNSMLGLIHLYTTEAGHVLEEDDLDFTLAVADQLALALDNLKERETLVSGLARVTGQKETLQRQLEIASELIGVSDAMNQLRERIKLIATTDAIVLIRGESGVGKELVARSIHFNSRRSNEGFVCMNCAALSESLLESELFGHEKGSFTGATERKIGRFEQADKGTLFLDEVGEMSPSIQARFLRVLEGHPFERVGGHKQIQVDVRVVAATNRDLEQAVEEGTFRQDLYFRLHVAEIDVQPLRKHPEDIEVLANSFLQRFVEKIGRPITGFTKEAVDVLVGYPWPGNIRELQNTIERTVILCPNELVCRGDLQLSAFALRSDRAVHEQASAGYRELSLAELEREHILATLEATDWNKSQAAQILGIERSTLDRKLKRYHVSRPERDGPKQ